MYAAFDRNSPSTLTSDVLSLSWKGDAKQGWLASGNSRKTVGVTYTEMRDEEEVDCDLFDVPDVSLERQAMRRNFNFREHTHEVTIVRWNKHLDKIATCDSSGTVIVWRNNNGRSIMELVNNRGTPISDFQWSNDGNKVLIAYVDGYVLVGTAYGRRIWARQLNLGSFVTSPPNHTQQSKLISSTWSPDDSRIVVGSSIGELIELDAIHGGTLVSTTEVLPGIGIIGLQWVLVPMDAKLATKAVSGSSLALGQIPDVSATNHGQNHSKPMSGNDGTVESSSGSVRLSLYLRNGKVVLMNSCGDQQATIIRTGLVDGKMLWSGDGAILAVAGFRKSQAMSTVRFFQPTGQLLFTLPLGTKEPVTAITWAHSDEKLFVATNTLLHSVAIHRGIPSLQTLCQATISSMLPSKDATFDLVLPTKLKVVVAETFDPVIQGHVPESGKLLGYVSKPPPSTHRTYCTVVPSMSISSNQATTSNGQRGSRHPASYTLYVEHLGMLIPVLEAQKRNSKIRQSFTISLPDGTSVSNSTPHPQKLLLDTTEGDAPLESNESGQTMSPSQLRALNLYSHEAHTSLNTESGVQLACREDDSESPRHTQSILQGEVPQKSPCVGENSRQLADVTSNVMASKFKIQGLSSKLPSDMGSIVIKTSFLHIQPRKVVTFIPQPELADSGIDTDSSSDESLYDDTQPLTSSIQSSEIFMEPENAIECLTSMEELQLPKSIELESQTLRPVDMTQQTLKSHSHSGRGVSVSDSHIQIHSKTPTWNEQHMIYQLDFGGRVTTKSAKNFQLELDGEQVLQFGRIDNGCFILDFQGPFSPIQAFATALANLV